MHGQYRSEVTCLECNNTSVAFDPFLMLNLPVPSKETLIKEISIVHDGVITQFKLEVLNSSKARDLAKKLPNELKSDHFLIGESEGAFKEVKRIITKGESIEKHREYTIFNHSLVEDDEVLVMCNFSSKNIREGSYGCGNSLCLTRLYKVKKQTLKDLHHEIFAILVRSIEQKDLNEEEFSDHFQNSFPSLFSDKKDDVYHLSAYNPGRAPCIVCAKEVCYGCRLAYSDESIEVLVNRSRDPCLFLNIIFLGDKNRLASSISQIKYLKNTMVEEQNKRNNENVGLTIYDCIKSFEEVEELDENNTIYCRRCKKHQKGTKKMTLFKLPQYLIINLKRFKRHGYSCQKNGAQVNFPLNDLEIKTHNEDSYHYDLYAVSNHYGSMGGGHYTAYGKNIDGRWYDFNDSSVSSLRDFSSITSAAAYVLFYKRSSL